MKKIFILFIILSIIQSCATMNGGIKHLPEPEPDKVMVIGCILLENIDLEYNFKFWSLPLEVAIIGRDEHGQILHFRKRTDDKGYYCFSNLPKASYILKAVIFQEPGKPADIIINGWDSKESKFYLMRHPEQGIEYKNEWFPEWQPQKIQNHHIIWFGLRHAILDNMSMKTKGDVMVKTIKKPLNSEYLWVGGHLYSREEPMTYFKQKFPNSRWW